MTMKVLSSCLSALTLFSSVEGFVQFNPIESLFSGSLMEGRKTFNATTRLQRDPYAPTPEEREAERVARRARMRERNSRVKEAMKYMRPDTVEKLTDEEMETLEETHPNLRKLGWGSNRAFEFADPGDDYDMWQQAYRMLGGFIDCDHQKDGDSHDSGDGGGGGGDGKACSRWMLWASVSAPTAAMFLLRYCCLSGTNFGFTFLGLEVY